MVLRVSPAPYFRNPYRGHKSEVKGNEELVIEVEAKANQSKYSPSVTIRSSGGIIEIKGNHFHELVKALLRYSDRDFKQVLSDFIAVTNDAAGGAPIVPLDLEKARKEMSVKMEADARKREKCFNETMKKRWAERCDAIITL